MKRARIQPKAAASGRDSAHATLRTVTARVRSVALSAPFALMMLGAGATAVQAQQRQAETVRPGERDRFVAECSHADTADAHGEGVSRLSDQCIPLAILPNRPRALIELGEPFLGTGTLHRGIRMPGGAVWQPALLAFGTIRSAVQGIRFPTGTNLAEAAGRVDFFGNLYLTQTERVLIGLRPIDEDGRFTSYTFTDLPVPADAPAPDKFQSELNATIRTLFFEGDLGEMLPNLDNDDSSWLDIYFSVGRQPLDFQDGLLLNEDAMDMVGLTRANMKFGTVVNTRIAGVYGWGQINRHGAAGNIRDDSASLFGLFTEIDFRSTTMQFDAAYVMSGETTGDGIAAGIGDIRRIGRFNNTFRVLASFPIGTETAYNSSGFLVHNQFSWTPHHNHNLWYIGAFVGINEFRSVARGPSSGGPLGQTGILFAAPGLGRVGAALSSSSDNAAGGSIGHQMFFGATRQQLLLEIGGRARTKEGSGANLAGGAARFQAAVGRRTVFQFDLGGAWNFDSSKATAVGRLELAIQM